MPVADLVTFGFAITGYTLLGISTALHAGRRPKILVAWLAAAAVALHVSLVWSLRFGFSVDKAVAKGIAGAVLFHSALLLIVAAPMLRLPWSARATWAAFAIVSAGAVGAVLKYSFVAAFRVPVVLVLVGTAIAVVRAVRAR